MEDPQENNPPLKKQDSQLFAAGNWIDDDREPDREKGWALYHEITLPTRKLGKNGHWKHLEHGEEGGELYPVWGTRLSEIGAGNFGLGVGLYFRTLMIMAFMFVILGVLNLYSMFYFNSDAYAGGEQDNLTWQLVGSAACTWTETVCLDLACDEMEEHRLCMLSGWESVFSLLSIALLCAFVAWLGNIQDRTVEEIDVREQTAQDYSVVVNDPDDDATDAREWAKFMRQFGPVAYVTVALDNGPLLRRLAERRRLLARINEDCRTREQYRAATTVYEDQPLHRPPLRTRLLQVIGFKRDLYWFRNRLVKLCQKITELEKKPFKATKVFVVFQTEGAQRACLGALTTGLVQAALEIDRGLPDAHKFRGTNVLNVQEAPEAEDVIWENLHVPRWQRLLEFSASMGATLAVLFVVATFIKHIMDVSASLAAIFISVCNGGLPVIIKIITSKERHPNRSNLEKSLLLKLVLARWSTAALIIWYINPFDESISPDFLSKVSKVLVADALVTPTARCLDVAGRLKRRVFSRLATTQAKLEKFFHGTTYFLAERYTDMTKTLFVSLFYLAVYPQGLFITAGAFLICYWVDKYCLFRVWRAQSGLDASLTEVSRGHMVLALLLSSLVSLHFYSGWPFDSLCPTGESLTDSVAAVSGADSAAVYEACDQESEAWLLGVQTGNWMTTGQSIMVKVYAAWCFLMTLFCAFIYFGKEAFFSFRSLFYGVYKPVGDDQHIPYFDVDDISAYIPMYQPPDALHPFLACKLNFNTDRVCFAHKNYDELNLNSEKDLPTLGPIERNALFSQVYEDLNAQAAAVKTGAKGLLGKKLAKTIGLA